MTFKQWAEQFAKTGTGCPHCGCRDSQLVRGPAISLGGAETRISIQSVCANTECGAVRTFAPKLEIESNVLFDVFKDGRRMDCLLIDLRWSSFALVSSLKHNNYAAVVDDLIVSGWPSDSSFRVEVRPPGKPTFKLDFTSVVR